MSKVSTIVILLVSFVAAGSTLKCYQCGYSHFPFKEKTKTASSFQKTNDKLPFDAQCLVYPPAKKFLLDCPENGGQDTCEHYTATVNESHYSGIVDRTEIINVQMRCGYSATTTDKIDECPDVQPSSSDGSIFVRTCKCHVDGCYFGPNGELPEYTTPIPGGPNPSPSGPNPNPGGPNPPPIPSMINKREPKRNGGQGGQKSSPITINILLVIASSAFLRI